MLKNERSLVFLCLFGMVIAFTALDGYMIHRSYQYFGGGALNRPMALTTGVEILAYWLEAIAYDAFFYTTVTLIGLRWVMPRFRPLTRLVTIFCVLLSVELVTTLVKWKFYLYFKDAFDLTVLKELTGGHFRNGLRFISPDQLFAVGAAALAGLAPFLLIKLLRPYVPAIQPWAPGRRSAGTLALASIAVIANHFVTAPNEHPRYGLSSKISYVGIDWILREATDFDRDGYGPLTIPPDPNNWNAKITPYAVDVPGNQIDEDGLAGDLQAIDPEVLQAHIRKPNHLNGMNVIVIIIETFRADVVNLSIDGRKVMPFLSSLETAGAYSDQMYSNYGVTAGAIQSIFAGNLHYREGDKFLFDELRDSNYRTYCVSGHYETWGRTDKILNLDRFDVYYDARLKQWDSSQLTVWENLNRDALTVDSRELNEKIADAIGGPSGRPFALYINYQDLHYPYYYSGMEHLFIDRGRIDAGFFRAENKPAIMRQYANAAHHLDGSIKELFDLLDRRGMMSNTVIAIVGDHPDSFYENGILGHAWSVDHSQRQTAFFLIHGKGHYNAPFGQEEIVPILLNSLDADGPRAPATFGVDEGKRVFELTGNLETPRQIAWISPTQLFTVDLKTRRVQTGIGREWVSPDALSSSDAAYPAFKALVNRWESEHWMRSGAGPGR